MIFGEIIVDLRKYLLLDLAYHYRKINGLASELLIRIVLRIGYLNLRRHPLGQSYNCFFELRQCLSSTNLQKIILALTSLKRLSANGSFKIQSDKVSRLHDSAILNRL